MIHDVKSKSPGLASVLLARLPAFAVAYHVFVGFTVTGIARKSHPILWRLRAAHFAQIHRLFICGLIITVLRARVNSVSPNICALRAACRR